MKERPILFSSSMVRAILEGRKTQTRRVVQFRKHGNGEHALRYKHPLGAVFGCDCSGCRGNSTHSCLIECPYGVPGDRLWVREAWRMFSWMDDPPALAGEHSHGLKYKLEYRADEAEGRTFYPDDSLYGKVKAAATPWEREDKWRPSIFMPRWASRILLEVTDIRVERVQQIGIYDIQAEGLAIDGLIAGYEVELDYAPGDHPEDFREAAQDQFAELWDSINSKRGRRKRWLREEWSYWTWAEDEHGDPEALGLDIDDPGQIRWRDDTDPDDMQIHTFAEQAPPCDGYYRVWWTPDDHPRIVYLWRTEGLEAFVWEGGYSFESNPWVWIIDFRPLERTSNDK